MIYSSVFPEEFAALHAGLIKKVTLEKQKVKNHHPTNKYLEIGDSLTAP
jgi:hypothetical protein